MRTRRRRTTRRNGPLPASHRFLARLGAGGVPPRAAPEPTMLTLSTRQGGSGGGRAVPAQEGPPEQQRPPLAHRPSPPVLPLPLLLLHCSLRRAPPLGGGSTSGASLHKGGGGTPTTTATTTTASSTEAAAAAAAHTAFVNYSSGAGVGALSHARRGRPPGIGSRGGRLGRPPKNVSVPYG
ncbi:unnamed protein product, partial [Discosporangium mesarthrocarpum]